MDATTLPTVTDLDELVDVVRDRTGVYLRWSRGPEVDEGSVSRDALTGMDLPGLCVSPLDREGWWTGSYRTWVARRVHDYGHLAEDGPDVVAWVLSGREVSRGPDNEPLVVDVVPLALVDRQVLAEATAELERAGRMGEWGTLDRRPLAVPSS